MKKSSDIISNLISKQILLETKSGSLEISSDEATGEMHIGGHKEPGIQSQVVIDPVNDTVTIRNLSVGTITADQYIGVPGSSGSGTPGGPNTSVQFNNLGNFGGSSDLTYNDTTKVLSGIQAVFTGITGSLVGNATTVTNGVYTTNISSHATTAVAAGAGLTGGGTVGSLTVNVGAGDGIIVNANDVAVDSNTVIRTTGNQTLGGAKTFSSYITGSITGSDAKFTSITGSHSGSGAGLFNLTASGITNFTNDVRRQFSAGANVTIVSGVISAVTGSGSGTPGGTDQSVQFNSGSFFSGSENLKFNYVTNTLSGTNNIVSNNVTIIGTASLSSIINQATINYNSGSNRVEILPGLFVKGNIQTTASVSASSGQFTTISASIYQGLPELFRISTTTSIQITPTQCSVFAKNTISQSLSITLPSAQSAMAKEYYFMKADSLTGSINIVASGSQTINGSGSFQLNGPYQSIALITDGIEWYIF